jgi:L-amino acid N-acyltransferase YncA/2-polyprenyl-3-methyl-5-hydroxy-6-metoxy-1,4-benzoquinol methylase
LAEGEGCCGSQAFGGALYAELGADAGGAALAASLGCGVPTAVADLRDGEVVLDLGSGAGADALISARRVAPSGRAIGLDMTEEMLELARANARSAGVANVEFIKGSIEEIPLAEGTVDVVISNCVINLAADKAAVLREVARVLRPGGRLAVSDVIADPDMDGRTRADMVQWTGCIAGALTRAQYEHALAGAGLHEVQIADTHRVHEHAAAATVRARKPAGLTLRPAAGADLARIAEIYNEGIADRCATFETRPRSPQELAGWLTGERPFIVAASPGEGVLGWARAGAYSDRCAYDGVGEHAVYVARAARGRGAGRLLLAELAALAERGGLYKLTSRVFADNLASRAAHRAAGFEEVGIQRRHGRVDGEWKDCVLVERLLGEAALDRCCTAAAAAACCPPDEKAGCCGADGGCGGAARD